MSTPPRPHMNVTMSQLEHWRRELTEAQERLAWCQEHLNATTVVIVDEENDIRQRIPKNLIINAILLDIETLHRGFAEVGVDL